MRKMKRKIMSVILGFCLLLSAVWTCSAHTEASGGDGWIKCDVGLYNLTFRMRIQPTISGQDVRITLSNEFGTGPLTIDTISIAKGYDRLPQMVKTWTRKM